MPKVFDLLKYPENKIIYFIVLKINLHDYEKNDKN